VVLYEAFRQRRNAAAARAGSQSPSKTQFQKTLGKQKGLGS
jgi:hypothetical protein